MDTGVFQTKIPVSHLLVDTQNPRLPETKSNQDEAIRLMLKSQGGKVFALARHLAENGTNPASLPIVIPADGKDGKYYVLDGNRRLTALRLLEHPHLGDGIFDHSITQGVKELSEKYKVNPIKEIECVVFPDREQADPWIQLIHRGQSQGAGLVEWDGQVAARYDERKGIGERGVSAALQILDLIKDHKKLSAKTREKIEDGKFPITNLTRLLNTPYVRKKIGLHVRNGAIESFEGRTVESLAQIIEDFGTEYRTVTDIKRVDQRIKYVDELFDPRPVPATPDTAQAPSSQTSTTSSAKKKGARAAKPRATVIPKDFSAEISQHRINKIFVELKSLNVEEFPNAVSVMLRVFLELSLDHYLETKIHWPEQQIDNSTLAQKLTAVANDIESKELMTSKQLAVIRKAAGGQTLFVASVKTLHAYVHNKHFSPVPNELRTAWDDLSIFISNLWPS